MNWKRYLLLVVGILIPIAASTRQQEDEMIVWDSCSDRWADDDKDAHRVCHVGSELLRRLMLKEHPPEVVDKVLPPNSPGITVICVNCEEINAWVYPQQPKKEQKIYITLPLAAELGSDDELACILGHELGHLWGPQDEGLRETQADEFGIGLVMQAGYDARACPRAMQRVGQAKGLLSELSEDIRSISEAVGFPPLDEHPPTPDRVSHMEEVRERGCREWPKSVGCRARTR